jgi:hypothetical protein
MRTSQASIAALVLTASFILPTAIMAQSTPPPGTTGTSVMPPKGAPVGRRQPRASGPQRDNRDKELDRVLNSICRGC